MNKIKINPFSPHALVHPGVFKGRVSEVTSLEGYLYQTKSGTPQHFIIDGERGIGKSSLFFYLSYIAKGTIPYTENKTFNFLTVHIELSNTDTEVSIIEKLYRELESQIAIDEALKLKANKFWEFIKSIEVFGCRVHDSKGKPEASEALIQTVDTIQYLLKDLEGSIDGIVILMDEADRPDAEANLGQFCKLFTEKLVKRDCPNVSIGLAGRTNLRSKLQESHESAPRIFSVHTLQPLEQQDAMEVIDAGLLSATEKNGFEVVITQEAKTTLANMSEGYPHFIQQFAFSAFEADTDNQITLDDVLSGAFSKGGAIDQLGHVYFRELYFDNIKSDEYRKVLNYMSESLDDWVLRKDIIDSGIKAMTVDNALSALKARGIIISKDSVKGQYKLPTKSFAVWIKALNFRKE